MKIATIRQVQREFSTVLGWVNEGEEVYITKHGKVVALLSPPLSEAPVRQRFDFAARLKLRDGDRVIPAEAMGDIMDHNRGDY